MGDGPGWRSAHRDNKRRYGHEKHPKPRRSHVTVAVVRPPVGPPAQAGPRKPKVREAPGRDPGGAGGGLSPALPLCVSDFFPGTRRFARPGRRTGPARPHLSAAGPCSDQRGPRLRRPGPCSGRGRRVGAVRRRVGRKARLGPKVARQPRLCPRRRPTSTPLQTVVGTGRAHVRA